MTTDRASARTESGPEAYLSPTVDFLLLTAGTLGVALAGAAVIIP